MLWKARQILGNEEDAEDCVQTAFMRIIKNFSHIEKNISQDRNTAGYHHKEHCHRYVTKAQEGRNHRTDGGYILSEGRDK